MRHALSLLSATLIGLSGLPAAVPAQGTTPGGGGIETAPLEPLRPRLPGGTVVPEAERAPLPDGVGTLTPPGSGEQALVPRDPNAPEGAAGTGDDDTATAAIDGSGETAPDGDSASNRRPDLFKKAPPGTGGTMGTLTPQPIEPVARSDAPGAELRQLDKLTGRIHTFQLTAGDERLVERLRVSLAECRAPVDGTTSNHIAFLRIWDTKNPDADAVFSGWMFADSPALSAMDHPRYDVWLIRCITASGSESSANR